MSRAPRVRVLRLIGRMNVGGPAWQVTALTEGLDAARFETLLVTGEVDVGETDFLHLRAPHLPVERLPTLGRSIRLGGDVRALADVVRVMRRFRPHIVHTHTAKAGVIGRVAARLADVPITVHTFHGHLLRGYFGPLGTGAVRIVERSLARQTTGLVAVGDQVRRDLLKAGIGRPEQYTVIAPGVELAARPTRSEARRALGLPTDADVVMYVARLTTIKRPDRFVDVAHRLAETHPRAVFAIAGDGELADRLRRTTADLGARFRMLGWRADLENVYAAADIVALTSDNEGMPVSLIEASLAGVPCVTTRVGSAPEVVEDGVTGIVTGTSPSELADAVARLLCNAATRRRFGEAAQARAERLYGVDRLVADTEMLYGHLIDDERLDGGRRRRDR